MNRDPHVRTASSVLARIRAKEAIRATQKLDRHRWAVMTLAKQLATRAVKHQFTAQGLRLSEVPIKVIHIAADAWFDVHRQELITEAEKIIAEWPGFARWRVVEKIPETEHCSATVSTIKGQITND